MGAQVAQVAPVEGDPTRADRYQATHCLQGGRLPGAIGAQERDDLPRRYRQAEAAYGGNAAIRDVEVFSAQHACRGTPRSRRGPAAPSTGDPIRYAGHGPGPSPDRPAP